MKARSALKNFVLWVSLAIVVNIFIYIIFGSEPGLEFLGGYIIELSLSVDNLFLFLLVFTSFNIPISYQKRVLTYGIFGAIVLRFMFIFLGVAIVNTFHWILYIFGFFLFCSGLKILFNKEEAVDFSDGECFFVRKNGVLHATPLLLILVLIESSDIIFAMDSIPAIFSITTNPYIVYSSNIFAILGLRSLYFLLAKLNSMFKYIKYGVAFILMFTGVKLFIAFFGITISTMVSLLVIAIILLVSILFSLLCT